MNRAELRRLWRAENKERQAKGLPAIDWAVWEYQSPKVLQRPKPRSKAS